MGNFFIFNNSPKELGIGIYGANEDDRINPFWIDSGGQLILSPLLDVGIQANNLDIKDLNPNEDNVRIAASDLDIRNLNGSQDSIKKHSRIYTEASDSGTIIALGTKIFLTRDTSIYKSNKYVVINTGGVAVTVTLQIAPIDNEAYYVDDGTSFSLLIGGTRIFKPSVLMKYTRIKVSAVLLGSVIVNYFGQT